MRSDDAEIVLDAESDTHSNPVSSEPWSAPTCEQEKVVESPGKPETNAFLQPPTLKSPTPARQAKSNAHCSSESNAPFAEGEVQEQEEAERWAAKRLMRLQRELADVRHMTSVQRKERLRTLQRELHPDKQPQERQVHAQQMFLLVQHEWEAPKTSSQGYFLDALRRYREDDLPKREASKCRAGTSQHCSTLKEQMRRADDAAQDQRRHLEEERRRLEEQTTRRLEKLLEASTGYPPSQRSADRRRVAERTKFLEEQRVQEPKSAAGDTHDIDLCEAEEVLDCDD